MGSWPKGIYTGNRMLSLDRGQKIEAVLGLTEGSQCRVGGCLGIQVKENGANKMLKTG